MVDVLDAANRCRANHRFIILDCCFAGGMGEMPLLEDGYTLLKEGVSILAAARRDEPAVETGARGGVFTRFVLDGLDGGAADVLGNVTLPSLYAYAELRLQIAQQQPIFKSNVSGFFPLLRVAPLINPNLLADGLDKFRTAEALYNLDHSFDPTIDEKTRNQAYNPANGAILSCFQEMRSVGLLDPVGHKHLYWAAVENKPCRLTHLGRLYWYARNSGRPWPP
jgi:hypothetical protein